MSYSIGNFTFETEEEYNKANAELEFINELKKQYNINDKDDAQKILEYLEANNKTFETSIGTWFIKMIDKKSGVNMGTRKPGSTGAGNASAAKTESTKVTAKTSQKSKPAVKKSEAESPIEQTTNSRLEKKINILLVLVVILLIITIIQEIQLIIGAKSAPATNTGSDVQINVGGAIDVPQPTLSDELGKGDIQDILLLAAYLGQDLDRVVKECGQPYKGYDDDKVYYFKSVYCRGYEGEICIQLDKKTNKVKYVEWECKRIVTKEPERVEKLNTVEKELKTVFDKVYVATGDSKWRTDFGNIQVTNYGQDFMIEMNSN